MTTQLQLTFPFVKPDTDYVVAVMIVALVVVTALIARAVGGQISIRG